MQVFTLEMAERLAKVAALTTSPSDGEALNAVRALNRALEAADIEWPTCAPPYGIEE